MSNVTDDVVTKAPDYQVAVIPQNNAVCAIGVEKFEENAELRKMPVSYLQELCGRKRVTPIYQLKAVDGMQHDSVFVYGVQIEDLTGIGQGKNKKVAKHFAARDALYRIVENDRYAEWGISGESREEAYKSLKESVADIDNWHGAQIDYSQFLSVPTEGEPDPVPEDAVLNESASTNPISKLFELCCQRRWPAPRYDLIEESGMPHEKTFVIKVELGVHEKTGTARTKKMAKRYAAEAMLKFVNEATAEELDKQLVREMDDDIEADEEQPCMSVVPVQPNNVVTACAEITVVTENEPLGILNGSAAETEIPSGLHEQKSDSKSTAAAKENHPPYWEALQNIEPTLKPCESHKRLLQTIGDNQGWTASFIPLTNRSKDGKARCIVSFNDAKHACFGDGDSLLEAEYAAALDALDFLKIMAAV